MPHKDEVADVLAIGSLVDFQTKIGGLCHENATLLFSPVRNLHLNLQSTNYVAAQRGQSVHR